MQGAVEQLAKLALQPAPADGHMAENIAYRTGIAGMFSDEANGLHDIWIFHRQHIGALPADDTHRQNAQHALLGR